MSEIRERPHESETSGIDIEQSATFDNENPASIDQTSKGTRKSEPKFQMMSGVNPSAGGGGGPTYRNESKKRLKSNTVFVENTIQEDENEDEKSRRGTEMNI